MAQIPTLAVNREKMAPWRRDVDPSFIAKIARKSPFSRQELVEYIQQANAGAVVHFDQLVRSGNLTPRPATDARRYRLAYKGCPDARSVVTDMDFLAKVPTIHELTAGFIIKQARMARLLEPGGTKVVLGHRKCGACAAALDYYDRVANGTSVLPPATVRHLLYAISEQVGRTVNYELGDPQYVNHTSTFRRETANARQQATNARGFLLDPHLDTPRPDIKVCPAVYDWVSGINWVGLSEHEIPNTEIRNLLDASARRLTDYALAEGRDFSTQYAAAGYFYDPHRLGAISDLLAYIGALGNEGFRVSVNLRPFDPVQAIPDKPQRVSTVAWESMVYASYDRTEHGLGHVSGVGGKDGTHLLGVLDRCDKTIEAFVRHLLTTYPVLAELVKDKKAAIIPMQVDPMTAKITYLQD